MRAGIPLALNRFRGLAQPFKRQAKRSSLALMLAILSAAPWKVAGRRLPIDFSGRSPSGPLSASHNDARTTALRGRELRRSARRLMLLRIRFQRAIVIVSHRFAMTGIA